MNAAFKRATDCLFDRFGRDALYISHGIRTSVQVVLKAPDRRVDFQGAHIHTSTHTIDVRTSQIPEPNDGDEVMLDGTRYRVQGEPLCDLHGLVWTLEAVPT